MAMHNPPHPGEFITAVYLEPNELSGRELAAKLGGRTHDPESSADRHQRGEPGDGAEAVEVPGPDAGKLARHAVQP